MSKLFTYNEYIDSTGIKGGGSDGFFEISGIDKIRITTEQAHPSAAFTFRVKILGQTASTILGTITGNTNKLFDVKTYDLFQVECTTYGGQAIQFSSTGFKVGAGSVQEIDTLANLPTPSGTGDIVWITAEESFFYDEPSSATWKSGTGSTVVLPTTQIAYGSNANTVIGKNTFTFNDGSDTLTVPNVIINGNVVLDHLYKPENVYTIANINLTNKSIILSETPTNPLKVRFVVEGGPEQLNGVDFFVLGNEIKWNGYPLDGVLELGDQVIITFN